MKKVKINKKAYNNYFVIEEFEAGIVLTGDEVKSIRNNACSIKESYARIDAKRMEMYIYNMTIDNYRYSSNKEYKPNRKRKLLLHKREIKRIYRKSEEKGYAIIPLSIYFNDRNIVKIKLGLCKGKKLYDKREEIKRRDFEREKARAIKNSF